MKEHEPDCDEWTCFCYFPDGDPICDCGEVGAFCTCEHDGGTDGPEHDWDAGALSTPHSLVAVAEQFEKSKHEWQCLPQIDAGPPTSGYLAWAGRQSGRFTMATAPGVGISAPKPKKPTLYFDDQYGEEFEIWGHR